MNIVDSSKENFEKAIEHLRSELNSLRTGRATPALVEDISVEVYGGKQVVKTLASISITDAKTLSVEPWDKTIMQQVEAAIRNSDLGISPVNDGKTIRLPLPELTHDRRQELIKVLHKKLEDARITIRKTREDIKKSIETMEKNKEIGEDDKFSQQDDLDKLVKEFNDKIKTIGEEKEKEITTV